MTLASITNRQLDYKYHSLNIGLFIYFIDDIIPIKTKISE